MKTCRACQQSKSLDDFGTNARSKDGHMARCRACVNASGRARYEEWARAAGIPKFIRDADRASKVCRHCLVEKPISEFSRRSSTKVAYSNWCKPCSAEKAAAWREANPEKLQANIVAYKTRHPDRVKASMRAWAKSHPEYERNRYAKRRADPVAYRRMLDSTIRYQRQLRSVMPNGPLKKEDVLALLSKPCHYCGGEAGELDHVVPISRGGLHCLENVVPACRSCNARKGAKTPEEWAAAKDTKG